MPIHETKTKKAKKSIKKKSVAFIKSKNAKKSRMVAFFRGLPYSTFLLTKYWQKVRQKVLKRDGNKCIICKSRTDLQVHHDTYKHHGNELEHLEDLMTLCRKCHQEHHY